MIESVQVQLGGRPLIIEVGKLAKQAGGAVTVRYGDTVVLVTACCNKQPRAGASFLPLTVDYLEKTFAAGKIPGGFFKREGRPHENETLTSRFIDRPIRPLFPEGFYHDMQVIATVLSADSDNEPDVLAMIGASTALGLSEAPLQSLIAGVRVARVQGQLVINPTPAQVAESDIDLIVAASKDAVVMVEGGAQFASEADILAAIRHAHEAIVGVIAAEEVLIKKMGKKKVVVKPPADHSALAAKVRSQFGSDWGAVFQIPEKMARGDAKDKVRRAALEALTAAEPTLAPVVLEVLEEMETEIVRGRIVKEGRRIDGRGPKDIRPITCEVGLLPRTHGSGLFTRGETQALVVATLGTPDDEQMLDTLQGEKYKRFMLHYNFPPFCVGEIKPLRSPGRREIGHGALAERAIRAVMPTEEEFPYTIRVVSEILESNGSSSMATVCGTTLSLLDAGVPIKEPVAGIAMGLIKEGNKVVILSDILGDEDHLGDMDFKVTGTRRGVTALQMDIKIGGISEQILAEALEQARVGRIHILEKMSQVIDTHRPELSPYAPRVQVIQIKVEKIKDLIGPGGKHIKGIVEETGALINVEQDGSVRIYAYSPEAMEKATRRVTELTAIPETGKIYTGKVIKIMEYGAFVEIMPGTEGLLHVSQLDLKRVENVTDLIHEGDEIQVKVLEVDPMGKIRLSRKATLPGYVESAEDFAPPPRRDGDRGGRDRGRGRPPGRR